MESSALLAIAVGLPLAGGLPVSLLGRWPNAREAASLLTAGALFAVVIAILRRHLAGEHLELELFEMMPGMPIAFEVEPLGMLFALVASGLWIVTTAYAIGYMRAHDETDQTRFFVCFAVAIAAAIGVALARNLLTLFVFYEALTLSTYPLVTHSRTEEARESGRVYLGILLTTSVLFLLLAILWTQQLAGTVEFEPGGILRGQVEPMMVGILLALFAFGTGKAALMPFHRWLPAAMVAPTPVSALLHAVAVVKAGVFSILKIVIYIFGIDLLAETRMSEWLVYVASFTILAASLIALTKDNLKARLAYSTISQLSYIVLGAALASSTGVLGGSMHIAMHAVGKITLFFVAGAIMVTLHKTEVSQMRGIGRQMPVTMACFGIAAVSIIGLPPMGGSWSKWFLLLGTIDSGMLPVAAVLIVSSLLSIAYLMPLVARAFFAPLPDQGVGEQRPGIREAPLFCLIPICLTALGSPALFFYADDLYELLKPLVTP
ncbi:MAG: monovalent cation/H+ antiporter subunit D family protein [Myxococcota bacterium]|nr:monovalent cation/H+ antiporter subunit D family protein [Myxococcota bacterium]